MKEINVEKIQESDCESSARDIEVNANKEDAIKEGD